MGKGENTKPVGVIQHLVNGKQSGLIQERKEEQVHVLRSRIPEGIMEGGGRSLRVITLERTCDKQSVHRLKIVVKACHVLPPWLGIASCIPPLTFPH